jgi:hypothetical protein
MNVLTGQTLAGLKREKFCAREPCAFHCRQRGATMLLVEHWIWHVGTDHICDLLPHHSGLCWCRRCGYPFPQDLTRADIVAGLARWEEIHA